MSNIFFLPSDMQGLTALGRGDIDHDDSLNSFNHQPPSYRSSELFGSVSLAPLPYTFNANDNETATFISGANLGHVDMPMDPPNRLSTLDSSSQTFQPGEMVPMSYVSNDVAASAVTQSDTRKVWATEHDWTRHRALITELYGENKLPEVMSIMESQKGFKATVKMYKTHVAKWGLDKKNKEPEMRAIVRKDKQRAEQGKRSNFVVRKRQLDFAEVVRYWQRKGVSIDEVIAQSTASPTPEAVECFTPPVSSPMTPPEDLATPEYILRIIRGYIAASFESGTWVKTDPRSWCYSIKGGEEAEYSAQQFGELCHLAVRLSSRQNFDEAENTVTPDFTVSRKMLIAEQPDILPGFFSRIVSTQSMYGYEMLRYRIHQLSVKSKGLLGESHPLCLLWTRFTAMPWSQIKDIISRCFDVITDDFDNLLGPMHVSTLYYHLSKPEIKFNLAKVERLLVECESALGSYDERTLNVRVQLMESTQFKRKHAEAKKLGEGLLAYFQRNQDSANSAWFRAVSYHCIALCQDALGQRPLAIHNLEVAINLRMIQFGAQDGLLTIWLLELELFYIMQFRRNEANAARDRRIYICNQQRQHNRTCQSGWSIQE